MKNFNLFLAHIIRVLSVSAFIVIAVFSLAGCRSSAQSFEPGIYTGTGQGYRGPIRVQVTVSPGGSIDDITIIEHSEDSFAVYALDELLVLVLELNSTEVDAVSGATVTSEGFLSAVDDALKKR